MGAVWLHRISITTTPFLALSYVTLNMGWSLPLETDWRICSRYLGRKKTKSLFLAVDLYTVRVQLEEGGERCVMAKKGFEGIKAVAASYLRLHPEVCACVYLLLCVCVCLCLWLCVCVSVFLCVCLIWPSNNYSANLVVRPATFHTNSHWKISALVHPTPLLVRPTFFRVWSLHRKLATKTGKRGSYLHFEDISSRFAC